MIAPRAVRRGDDIGGGAADVERRTEGPVLLIDQLDEQSGDAGDVDVDVDVDVA